MRLLKIVKIPAPEGWTGSKDMTDINYGYIKVWASRDIGLNSLQPKKSGKDQEFIREPAYNEY